MSVGMFGVIVTHTPCGVLYVFFNQGGKTSSVLTSPNSTSQIHFFKRAGCVKFYYTLGGFTVFLFLKMNQTISTYQELSVHTALGWNTVETWRWSPKDPIPSSSDFLLKIHIWWLSFHLLSGIKLRVTNITFPSPHILPYESSVGTHFLFRYFPRHVETGSSNSSVMLLAS